MIGCPKPNFPKLQELITSFAPLNTVNLAGLTMLFYIPYQPINNMNIEHGILLVLSIIAALFIGAVTRHVLKHSKLPYTVALLIIGLAIGLFDRYVQSDQANTPINQAMDLLSLLDPHLILFVFLPILIFESAFSVEVHLFRRIFGQIAVLAVPGLIVSTLATACFAMWLLPVEWSWTVALLFGALISATDPVAVVALLKEVCSRKRLETLIEGESLLNDGTAIVLFTLFLSMLTLEGNSAGLVSIASSFIWVVSLGFVIGLVLGGLCLLWIGRVFNDPLVEICLSIGTAYLVFFVAEHVFHASGVVALVTSALLFAGVGRTQISSEVAGFMHKYWEVMAYIANTLIFLLVGILIAKRLDFGATHLWLSLIVLYLGLQLIRAGSVALFMPVLKRIGIGINRDKAIVLVWGGLRGAVALALALTLVQGDLLKPSIADEILFLCAGVVVLTLIINATTMSWLLAKLGLDQLPPAKQATVTKAKRQIQEDLNQYIPALEQDEFLYSADWQAIRAEFESKEDFSEHHAITNGDLVVAFERRLLEAERKQYWIQYHEGVTDKEATNVLVESVERALDGIPTLSPRDKLIELWQIPAPMRWTSRIAYINRLVVNLYYRKMTLDYEITCGFIRAQKTIASYVDDLAPEESSAQRAKQAIEQNISDAHQQTELIRQVFPELISEIETAAAKSLLHRRKRAIVQKLLAQAVLDKPEAQAMIVQIESELALLQVSHNRFEQPKIASELSSAYWTQDLENSTLNRLIAMGSHRVFAAGDAIFHFGDNTGTLAIIVRGSAELISPLEQTSGMTSYGPGSILGLEALKGGGLKHSVVARSPVDCIWLPGRQLRPLLNQDPHLKQALQKAQQP